MPAAAHAPLHKRRAGNMFPCASEVSMCDSFSAALDALRENNKVRELSPVNMEESCLDCVEERNGKQLTAWASLLFTMRMGPLEMGARPSSTAVLEQRKGRRESRRGDRRRATAVKSCKR